MKKVSGVSFEESGKIYYFNIKNNEPKKGDFVIVDTDRGMQFGEVVTDIISVDEKKLNSKLREILRIADKVDAEINSDNVADANSAMNKANELAVELGLEMNVINANFTFDRRQLMFNFLADDRVDFRELARKLASLYRTRIELRQIGVRDKARLVGGYGQCGKKLCCSGFLNDISSVSINMAKNQNLALNPQKINGVCGRLMCCLSYENDSYKDYKKGLPRVGEKITHKGEKGKVIFVDLFNRSYKIETEDSKIIEVNE